MLFAIIHFLVINSATNNPDFNFKTLANGLPVLRVPLLGTQSVTVLVLANTGSRYEAPGQEGLAHFFEHLVFKGTRSYPSAQILARTIDGIGANFNAFTGKEYTGYYVQASARHTELALDVVSDMILAPLLPADDIEREKNVIIEEINLYQETPQRHIHDLFADLMFADQGLAHRISGDAQRVKSFQRADLVEFLQSWYGLPNLVLVVAGQAEKVMAEQTLAETEQNFSKADGLAGTNERVADDRVEERVKAKVKVKADLEEKLKRKSVFGQNRLAVEKRDIKQAHFILGWPGFDRHDERRYALSLLSTILGGNMSSRLFTEVREKRGLAYYVRSEVSGYHEAGVLGASAGVDANRVEEALAVTKKQFTSLANGENLITDGELERAKEYAAGKLALELEDSQSMAKHYGLRQLLLNQIKTPEEDLAKMKAVTLEEVQAAAETIIQPGEMWLALIGPFAEADKTRFEKFVK